MSKEYREIKMNESLEIIDSLDNIAEPVNQIITRRSVEKISIKKLMTI